MNNILEFCGYRYNATKLEEVIETIDESEDIVININDSYDNVHGGGAVDHYKVCRLCGKIIVNSYHGYGSECWKSVKRFIPIVAKINPKFGELMSEYNLKRWIIYSHTLRDFYVSVNKNDKGEFKNSEVLLRESLYLQ